MPRCELVASDLDRCAIRLVERCDEMEQRGLPTPVARELVELHLARDRPDPTALVFADSAGGHLRRHNWRRRVWIPALERAGAYFRSYDLRHTCATLLLYDCRTLNEVAEHLATPIPGSRRASTRT